MEFVTETENCVEPISIAHLDPISLPYDFDWNENFTTISSLTDGRYNHVQNLEALITSDDWCIPSPSDLNEQNIDLTDFPSTTPTGDENTFHHEEFDLNSMIESPKPILSQNETRNNESLDTETENVPVPLSESVQVIDCSAERIQLVTPLEQVYRPRYKSDYFPSQGASRKPRYVADTKGHHHVTIKIPDRFTSRKNLWLRVALVTTDIPGLGHFYSPYKFQKSNTDSNVADENPTYIPVDSKEAIVKLYLVLIKSKMDQLMNDQPLRPFSDRSTTAKSSEVQILKPKELINRYKLDQSHIAFTLCTRETDGRFTHYNQTTTLSSVITETTSKLVGRNKSTNDTLIKPNDSPNKKNIQCPHCCHRFSLEEAETSEGKNSKKRTANQKSTEKNDIKQPPKRKKRNYKTKGFDIPNNDVF